MDHKAFQKVLAPIDFGEHSQEYGMQMYEHGKRQGYREAIEAAARVADGFTCGCCGMDGKAGKAIRALLPKDAVDDPTPR